MSTFKVEVTEYGEKQGDDRYPPSKTIYTQTFDVLDLRALIAAVNCMIVPDESEEPPRRASL